MVNNQHLNQNPLRLLQNPSVVLQTPIQEPIQPTTPQQPVQPQQTAPQQTPPPRAEAPVRLNRQQLTPQPTITGYGNLGGVQQVSPNRGDYDLTDSLHTNGSIP